MLQGDVIMRLLEINSVCGIRSTGRITIEIAEEYIAKGFEVMIAYGREEVPEKYRGIAYRIGTESSIKLNVLETRLLDNDGFTARKATKDFIQWAEEYNPDVLWLHNLHGYYINVQQLFDWIKARPEMKVYWTLHDCWSFTGHCSYFTYAKCDKWKTHCINCIQKMEYPASYLFDRSSRNFDKKKALFSGVKNMTIVTPSKWLAELVKNSYLKDYEVIVRNNTIDLKTFKPKESNIKQKLGVEGKKVILGVAAQWLPLKGYSDFFTLRERLSDEYAIIMVGLTEKQLREIPAGIIGIKNTNNVDELVELYSAADVFFNPTYEDNYPTVNLEARACGTTVLTYNSGGSPESVPMDCVFSPGDIDGVLKKINQICSNTDLNP